MVTSPDQAIEQLVKRIADDPAVRREFLQRLEDAFAQNNTAKIS